jgi:branched-chain amino acid transport system permease protein
MSRRRAVTPARLVLSAVWVVAVALVVVGARPGLVGANAQPDDVGGAGTVLAAQDGGEQLHTTLRVDGEPVSDVTVRVETAEGELVEEAVSDETGRIEIDLPGPGQYRAVLDTDTLPEGVGLRDPERATLEPTVSPGARRPLLFPLQRAGQANEPSTAAGPLDRLANSTVKGLRLGLLIGITSIGLSLVFGTTRLINFAHGDMVTFGMVVAYLVHVRFLGLPLVAAGLLAVIAGGVLGAGLERAVWDPLRRRQFGIIQLLVVSIGLSFLLRYLILLIYGSRRENYEDFTISSTVSLGPFSAPVRDLAIMGISIVVLLAVGFMLTRTRLGTAIRAVADNRDLAESSGIDVRFVILLVWILGGALAAFGGVLYGASVAISWLSGFRLLLLMFAGVILGGIGTAFGALAGSLVVGLGVEISAVWMGSELKYVWALLILIVVLMVRPQGIFGVRERVG